jgi:hypothetical protein
VEIRIDLPMAGEGTWKLIDSDGNELTTSFKEAGAYLMVEPFFYKGVRTQVIGRASTNSIRGRTVKHTIRSYGGNGKIIIEQEDTSGKPKKRIIPGFDRIKSRVPVGTKPEEKDDE